MRFIFGNSIINKRILPKQWCGSWIDINGKYLEIDYVRKNRFKITIKDSLNGNCYKINLLDGTIKRTEKLDGLVYNDSENRFYIEIEAGTIGIGPTLKLYFVNHYQNRAAVKSDIIEEIRILPKIGLGLYDDFEDDLGVSWAFPLELYKKIEANAS